MVLPHTAFARLFTRALVFNGRSSRSEFWWGQLMLALVMGGAAYALATMGPSLATLDTLPMTSGAMGMAFMGLSAALTLAGVTAQARRLHDAGYSALWILLSFVPLIGAIVLLVLMVMPSQQGSNKWGTGPDGSDDYDPRPLREGGLAELSPSPSAKVTPRKATRKTSAWDSYAILANGDADAPPPPQVVEARRNEVSDYYRRHVLKQPSEHPAE